MRVFLEAPLRQRDAHQAQQVDGKLPGLRLADRPVRPNRLGDLGADPVTSALAGRSPITARQLTVLPDPDSPTTASVCLG